MSTESFYAPRMTSRVEERLHLLGLAEYLELPPPLVEQLLRRSILPGQEAGGLWNFDRAEVDRWLDLGMPGWHHDELHAVAAAQRTSRVSLAAALQRGNAVLDLPVSDARRCLERVVATLDLPSAVDRPTLLKRLLASSCLARRSTMDSRSRTRPGPACGLCPGTWWRSCAPHSRSPTERRAAL